MRRIAPFALLIYSFTVLLFLSKMYFDGSEVVLPTKNVFLADSPLLNLNLKKSGLYEFKLSQDLDKTKIPNYSELDVELLDQDYKHVYSFYKNLWLESHSNGSGTKQVYEDNKMEFSIHLKNAGEYLARFRSFNNNLGAVRVSCKRLNGANFLLKPLSIFFFILSILLILGTPLWGNPITMLSTLNKGKKLKYNDLFIFSALILTVLIIWINVNGISSKGYPSAGDEYNTLPNKFFDKKDVLYIG